MQNPVPQWLREALAPENASVLDSWPEKAAKATGRFLGLDDPQSQLLSILNPTETGVGGLSKAIGTLMKRVKNPIKAYHGSPHDFDQFSLSKIGTGEGAQAYGHGLYFAEQEAVAKEYANQLAQAPRVVNDKGETVYQAMGSHTSRTGPTASKEVEPWGMALASANGNHAKALKVAKSELAKAIESDRRMAEMGFVNHNPSAPYRQSIVDGLIANKGKAQYQPGTRMYEVSIHADPEDFLDWDAPLSQQSEKVRQIAQQVGPGSGLGPTKAKMQAFVSGGEDASRGIIAKGEDLYRAASDYGGKSVEGSEALKRAGIPGIKYLDGASRSAGQGSRNYVVFDDALIEIRKKYAHLLPVLGAAEFARRTEAMAMESQKDKLPQAALEQTLGAKKGGY
jgi:hypothetical protein